MASIMEGEEAVILKVSSLNLKTTQTKPPLSAQPG